MGLFGAFNQMGPMGALGGAMGQPAYGTPPTMSPAASYFGAPALQTGAPPAGAPMGGMGGAIGSMLPHLLGGVGGGMGGAMSSLVPQVMGQPGGLGGAMAHLVPQAMGGMGATMGSAPQPQMQSVPTPPPQPGMGMAMPFQQLMSQFGPIGGMSPSLPGNVGAFMNGGARWAPFGSMGAFG